MGRCQTRKSRERVPDVVFRLTRGDERHYLVFDAKYRTSRSNVLDAMASAHIYQDSLRWHSRRPESSILLIPGPGGVAWLEQPDFQVEHRVGVEVLSPGTPGRFPHALERLLAQTIGFTAPGATHSGPVNSADGGGDAFV